MKLISFLLVLLSTVSFGGTFGQDAYTKTMRNKSDKIVAMTLKTVKRKDFYYYKESLKDTPSGNGQMTWVINATSGDGLCIDSTGAISSIYKVYNASYNNVKNQDGSYTIMISGIMQSNAGNSYMFTINDRSALITMQGPAIDFTVYRKFLIGKDYPGTGMTISTVGDYTKKK